MNGNEIRADLHSHTNASDGLLTPSELVFEASRRGLSHIAISDHDTVAGIEEARRATDKIETEVKTQVIAGVELTCSAEGREVHMLGLCVDPENSDLLAFTQRMQDSRRERYLSMIQLLRDECGLDKLQAEDFETDKQGSLGRPELARALVKLGYVKRLQDAFDEWLGRGKPAFVRNTVPDYQEAVDAIHSAGGASILAHCGLYRDGEALAAELLDKGVMGVEIFHPDHSMSRRDRLLAMARQKKALVTGGADFHEPGAPKAKHFGRLYIGEHDLERLFEATN